MFNRKRLEEVFGETVREVRILVLVFAPLDAAFAPGSMSLDDLSVSWRWPPG
jgi:hypothetical protein